MADSASESDSSSIDGLKMPSPASKEQLFKRIESLEQEKRVLKMELETYKLRCKSLMEENRALRKASVTIQAKAEQEEEYISNTLLKKIEALKKEKETLAMNYEQEEEFLTNDLSRKLNQLRQEKVELEETLEREQEFQVNKLMRKIEKLETDILSKQSNLEQLRREKIELENTLEQEQEALVNRLWKRMDKLEAEKRMLQEKLDQPVSTPPSPMDILGDDTAGNLASHITHLKSEILRLRKLLENTQAEHSNKMAHYAQEERHIREENIRLQRKLQLEMDRREALCRHLSESESSLEMDDERHFNEAATHGHGVPRSRTASSPIPYPTNPGLSPGGTGLSYPIISPSNVPAVLRCSSCGNAVYPGSTTLLLSTSPPPPPPPSISTSQQQKIRPSPDKFAKPTAPPPHSPKS